MDDTRFDRLTRAVRALTTRRTALQTVVVSALAALGLADADAKKKKKKKKKKACKAPNTSCGGKGCCTPRQSCVFGACVADECDFAKTRTEWTLQADCTVTRVIQIPNGVTLDGNSKTMTMDSTRLANLLQNQQQGTVGVRNLTARAVPASAGVGLSLPFSADATVQDSTFDGFSIGLRFVGGSATVQRTTLRGGVGAGGIVLDGDTSATIEDGAFELGTGVVVPFPTEATIRRNAFQGAHTGVNAIGGHALVIDNTIVGPDVPLAIRSFGISFGGGATGEATGNTISKYFDTDPEATSCGIFLDPTTVGVTLGANTFPDPPGNEQNVCDNRP